MSQNDIQVLTDLGSLPFHIGVTTSPSNEHFPDTLPFCVGIRSDINLMVQAPNLSVKDHLDKAYRIGSLIGTPMSEEGIGRRYAEDFLTFITRFVPPDDVKNMRVLEVGCGNGYLLHRIQKLGAHVLGIEPGKQGQIGAQKYGLDIRQAMFPLENRICEGNFDLIIHYAVLEHVADPSRFISVLSEYLSPSGVTLFSVPDCTENLRTGDISMFLHEHWNYFTPSSLRALLANERLTLHSLEKSGYGGALYGIAGKSGTSVPPQANDDIANFERHVREGIENSKKFFEVADSDNRSIGVFCAGRCVNLLHIVSPRNLPRFFDDDVLLHGKYYPPLPIRVESRKALLEDPVNELLIMSRTFGSQLKDELRKDDRLQDSNITLAEALF